LLADRVHRLASLLRGRGLGPGARIGLWFPEGRWIDYAIGYFATARTGACAVVLPTDADTRVLRRIHGDVAMAVVVSAGSQPSPLVDVPTVAVSEATGRGAARAFPSVDGLAVGDVIFTSGSTGTPKGVAATHGALVELANRYRDRSGGALVVGHAVSHSTAIGTRQILVGMIARGATIVSGVPFDARRFLELAAAERVETAVLPAGTGRALVRALETAGVRPLALRKLRFVSDRLDPGLHRQVAALLPATRVVNVYGLTEAGDAHLVITQDDCHLGPGGYPGPGTEVRVMSRTGEWAPPGVDGWVCIRDALQPLAYFSDPGLSDLTWRDGWTITRDVGLVDDTGRVHLKGRAEWLARIGGRTISTLHVEQALAAHPGIAAAAVAALDHPTLGQTLAAVVEAGTELDVADVRTFLHRVLPDYAVPAPIVPVLRLPRSRTGKAPRDAILDIVRKSTSPAVRPCRTGTEAVIASAWAQVLELGRTVGPDDDFFALGGDSLAAVEVAVELEAALGVPVPLDWLFTTSNLGELASALDQSMEGR
jgi:acyl-coenzyme A synthetase/AMP-(fatty) acid ligase/acyl carrier protein